MTERIRELTPQVEVIVEESGTTIKTVERLEHTESAEDTRSLVVALGDRRNETRKRWRMWKKIGILGRGLVLAGGITGGIGALATVSNNSDIFPLPFMGTIGTTEIVGGAAAAIVAEPRVKKLRKKEDLLFFQLEKAVNQQFRSPKR